MVPSQQLRQEEGGQGCWLGGRACSLSAPPWVPGQGGGERLAGRALTCSLSYGQACFAGAGRAKQPAVESENFPLPEPAAGCHLGRGSASFPNLPSLWRAGELCAGEISSPHPEALC